MDWQATLTEEAAQHLLELASAMGVRPRLRVAIEGGGCSGFRYRFSFDEQHVDGDQSVEREGVMMVTDPISALYLAGARLDYVENLNGASFQMHNPGARSTCGCGQSFEA